MMRKARILLALAAAIQLSSAAFGEDPLSPDLVLEEESDTETYQFPKIETDSEFHLGYQFIDIGRFREAAEYEYPKDSLLFGGKLNLATYPHRLHLDFEFGNTADYFGDGWYTYKDIFYIRAVNSTFFHNLSNLDLDPFYTGAGVDIRDRGETYDLKTGLDHYYIRGKVPGFPLHVYMDGRIVRKNGDLQQRSLLGGAWFNDIARSSQRRTIDFLTTNVKVGINSHVGPIEIDYAHGEKRFEAGNDSVLYDAYGQSGFGPPPGMRPAGVYPHDLIPNVESSSDTVKIHTSHTGKIVATATFQRTKNENQYSGAQSEYLIGSGGVTLMPMPKLSFFLEYRHKDTDIDNPNTATITDRTNPSNRFTYPARSSISSNSNNASIITRFRPLSWLTLNARYRYRGINRKNAEEWGLPKDSQEHTARISARTRIGSSIQANAEYIHREINDPAYNIDPDSSNEGRLSLTWLPAPRVSAFLSYDIAKESRDDLHFIDTDEPDNRDVRKDSVIGSITYRILDELSLTASYAFLNYEIEQDIEYHDAVGTPHADEDVDYTNKAHSVALDVHYAPHDLVDLSAGISHTMGKSSFSPNDSALLEPEPISSFSKMKTEQTDYNASCDIKLVRGFSSGVHYRYVHFDDDLGNSYDDAKDGDVHILRMTLSKRW
jgi:hypothetical protein